jgi:hypothetical protein
MHYVLSPSAHPEYALVLFGSNIILNHKAGEPVAPEVWFLHSQIDGSYALHPKLNSAKHAVIHQSSMSDAKSVRLAKGVPSLAVCILSL